MAAGRVIDLDLTGYKDRTGQRITPGRYRFIVHDAEVDEASTGNKMIMVWLRVVGGNHDSAVILDRLVYTEKSLFRIVNFMRAIGLPTPLKRLRVDVTTWIGRQVDGDVEDDEPYKGNVKSVVRGYMQVEGGATVSSEPVDLDSLDGGSAGMEEFAPATTSNPAAEANGVVETPAAAEAAMPEPPTDEPPTEVDLDSLELG